jgi:hypothetical protein
MAEQVAAKPERGEHQKQIALCNAEFDVLAFVCTGPFLC